MKKCRFAAWILLTVFLTSLPGIAGAVISPVGGVSLSPGAQAKYTMGNGGHQMSIESGKVDYTLKKGAHYTFTHGARTYQVTANSDVTGSVTVNGDVLSFVNSAGQLIVTPFAGGLAAEPLTIAPTAAISTSAPLVLGAGVAAVGGAVAGLTGGHGGSTPPVSPQ
ncbi:exported hypothetical protein [Syntrophobacter sp. SbD1]|nr:exported hypothetical protein [Syntrophobacter sp. SbD1]